MERPHRWSPPAQKRQEGKAGDEGFVKMHDVGMETCELPAKLERRHRAEADGSDRSVGRDPDGPADEGHAGIGHSTHRAGRAAERTGGEHLHLVTSAP